MAINFTNFFTRIGKAIDAYKKLLAASGSATDTEFQEILDAFDSDPIDVKRSIEGTITTLRALQSSVSGSVSSLISIPMNRLLTSYVDADVAIAGDISSKLREFIRQMEVGSESVLGNTVSAALSVDGVAVGTGTIAVGMKDKYGRQQEFAFNEILYCAVTSTTGNAATISVTGEQLVSNFDYRFPFGSGVRSSLNAYPASQMGGLIPTPTMADENTVDATSPSGWIGTDTDATASITDIEVQTITISGTPTGGSYIIKVVDRSGNEFATTPIAYNDDGGGLQSAIQDITGFSTVTVSTSGTSPNYTHTVTFTGVTNPGTMTYISNLTGGTPSIAVAVTTSSADAVTGGRVLRITGDGSEQTTWHIPVSVNNLVQYGWAFYLKEQAPITSGVLQVALVDGIDGTIINNEAGDAQSSTIDLTAVGSSWYWWTGFFQTPAVLPANVYLQIKCTTAIDAAGILDIDSANMIAIEPVYPGGPVLFATVGDVNWDATDRRKVTVSNNYAGQLHAWFDRVFNLRSQGLQLPTSGTPTQAEALIS